MEIHSKHNIVTPSEQIINRNKKKEQLIKRLVRRCLHATQARNEEVPLNASTIFISIKSKTKKLNIPNDFAINFLIVEVYSYLSSRN